MKTLLQTTVLLSAIALSSELSANSLNQQSAVSIDASASSRVLLENDRAWSLNQWLNSSKSSSAAEERRAQGGGLPLPGIALLLAGTLGLTLLRGKNKA